MTAISGTTAWSYEYNADGLRISRTDGTSTYDYVYLGGQLVKMTINGSTVLRFAYDADGSPMSLFHNESTYYYVKNLQGDVLGLVNNVGTPVVAYTYDAWGNILSVSGTKASTIGAWNPLRYRGYVYDSETGLYYLQSRYYNPEWGRFINADVFVATGQGILGNNMFAYCRNNPVSRKDALGTDDVTVFFDDGSDGTAYNEPIDPEDAMPGAMSTSSNGLPAGGGSNGQYKAPAGGGGVTNSQQVGETTVDFGHGGRHIDTNSVNLSNLENSIASDVVNRPPSYDHATSVYDFIYSGRPLYYSYYTRDAFHINVGTYYFMDQLR